MIRHKRGKDPEINDTGRRCRMRLAPIDTKPLLCAASSTVVRDVLLLTRYALFLISKELLTLRRNSFLLDANQ
jgi:hypothetical protein